MTYIVNTQHKENLNRNKIFFVNIISLPMGFTGGLLIYTMSAYFKNIWDSTNIGWIFTIANIILFIILLNIHKFVRIIGRATIFQLLIICKISIFIALIMIVGRLSETLLLMSYIVLEALSWTVLRMILESYAIDNKTGRIYGLNLTFINVGLIISPIIATRLLMQFGFVGIFYLSIIFNILIFIITFFNIHHIDTIQQKQINYIGLFQKLKARKDIQRIFAISISLEFFFAIMVIYAPLYLLDNGFSWNQIGIIFTVMLIPLVLAQYPIGILADIRLGEKELLFISFILIIFSSIAFYFFGNSSMTIVITILLISRIGAALVSILRLSYFYKRIDKTDVDMIALFQTARPIAYVVAPALVGLLFIYFQINSVFILIAFIALFTLYPIYKLSDNKSLSEI